MILAGQLRAYASINAPENNTTLSGGVIDYSTIIDFSDMSIVDNLQAVSSNAFDTSVQVSIYGRLANGIINNETVTLNGRTPVPTVTYTAWERIMKCVKGSSASGDIAVEQVTAIATGTIQEGGSTNVAVLDTSASGTDGAYVGMVFRVTSGTGVGSIAKILNYEGDTQTALFDKVLTLDSTSVYRISVGVVFNKAPHEIMTVRRPFWNALASASGGADQVYYEKFFWSNDSSESLQGSSVQEVVNPLGQIQFGVDPTLPSTSSVVNRLTAPVIAGLVFGRTPQVVPTVSNILASGQAVGVWLMFTLPAGQTPRKTVYMSGLVGQTS